MKQRIRVTGPDEPSVVYPKGREPKNFTAFRVAERQYKKKDASLDGCLDLRRPLDHPRTRSVPGRPGVYTLDDECGFTFMPGYLSVEQQLELLGECLTWPGLSNLDAHFEQVPKVIANVLGERKRLSGSRFFLPSCPFPLIVFSCCSEAHSLCR